MIYRSGNQQSNSCERPFPDGARFASGCRGLFGLAVQWLPFGDHGDLASSQVPCLPTSRAGFFTILLVFAAVVLTIHFVRGRSRVRLTETIFDDPRPGGRARFACSWSTATLRFGASSRFEAPYVSGYGLKKSLLR